MRKATILLGFVFLFTSHVWGQQTDYRLTLPASETFEAPYTTGLHSGVRDVAGPFDLDGDGKMEVLVADYSGGGRVHVVENIGVDTWELVYSSPVLDSTATTNNIRAIAGGDLDGDGNGEFMFLGGRNYSETNPNISSLPPGLYVFEFTGTDDDYGTAPASIYEFNNDLPDRWRVEQMTAVDVDGDGTQEVLMANNGGDNRYDNWYVVSVSGDIGSGFEVWIEELRLSSRASEDFDPVNRGGGSPYGIVAGDLDGDGTTEISMHSWNSFNFTNARATGPDTYEVPGETAANVFLQATPEDHVSLFGGVGVDINNDGDIEVYYPRFQTGTLAVLNYETGEDPLQITSDNLITELVSDFSALGITAGDMDGDGNMELIGSGPSYTSSAFNQGQAPAWIRIVEYKGGDVEDPASYSIQDVTFPDDMIDGFDTVVRDSAGVITEYREDGPQGPEFVSKLAYLGDVDDDGWNEVALGFQGVDDSTFVYDEVFNPSDSTYTRTQRSAEVNDNRVFMRIVAANGLAVNIEDDRVIVPSDYVLSANYPNPFNPTTSFTFTLPIDKRVSVKIYDVMGRLIETLVDNEFYTSGTHQVSWDGTSSAGHSVASGTYLYTLEYGNFRQSRKMLLVK